VKVKRLYISAAPEHEVRGDLINRLGNVCAAEAAAERTGGSRLDPVARGGRLERPRRR
jgi:hypothetical protein